MKAGFSRVDITPRLGLELAGFGPYLYRRAEEIRDRLYARAMAADDGTRRWVVVSADLIGLDALTVARARQTLRETASLPPECVMMHATHTHSGPAVLPHMIGWGQVDEPYLARLPWLLAQAGAEALENLQEVEFAWGEFAAEGISYNRELDVQPAYADALREDWRPARPEHTDTVGRVVCAYAGGRLAGFLSSFACHPVICCEQTHSIHGDFCGVAMNLLEAEYEGAVGMFLQGGHGDLNTCVCHVPQAEALRALDVIARRFAACVRRGIAAAEPLDGDSISAARHRLTFRTQPVTAAEIRAEIDTLRRKVRDDPEADAGRDCRMHAVFLTAAERTLDRILSGGSLDADGEVQALRLGRLLLVGTPFELFRGTRQRASSAIGHEPALVLSTTNDFLGYAPTQQAYRRGGAGGGYACHVVPRILGGRPFRSDVAEEIAQACARVSGEALGGSG